MIGSPESFGTCRSLKGREGSDRPQKGSEQTRRGVGSHTQEAFRKAKRDTGKFR